MQAEQFIALSHNASLLITLPDHCQRLLDGEYPRSSNPSELVTLQSWPRFNTVLFLPLRSDLEHIPPMSPGPSEPPTILNAVLHHGPYRSQRLEKGVCVFLPLPHVSRHVTRCIVIPPGHRRCPCQRVIHLPPTVCVGSHRRPQFPRETGSTFSACIRILRYDDRSIKGTSTVGRRRNQKLYYRVGKGDK